MRDEEKSFFPGKIAAHDRSGLFVQMVCRLIDEKEVIIPQKQRCQQNLGAFTAAELIKRHFIDGIRQSQQVQFPADLPLLSLWAKLLKQLISPFFFWTAPDRENKYRASEPEAPRCR